MLLQEFEEKADKKLEGAERKRGGELGEERKGEGKKGKEQNVAKELPSEPNSFPRGKNPKKFRGGLVGSLGCWWVGWLAGWLVAGSFGLALKRNMRNSLLLFFLGGGKLFSSMQA